MISIQGLNKSYGEKMAVENLSLEIAGGEFFAFLGPNGAGKTTTIKILTGLLRPTQGAVKICGLDIVRENLAAKRQLSYVPDQPYLYDKLTGYEFLQFVGEMYGMSASDLKTGIPHFCDYFEMNEYIHTLTEDYSHGMKQRVALASALLHHPKVLVLDEPMVGLDPKSARIVKDLLRDEARKGMTIFMSTHTLSVAEETADRIGIIDRGKLIALGAMSELQDRYQKNGGLEDIFLSLTGNVEE